MTDGVFHPVFMRAFVTVHHGDRRPSAKVPILTTSAIQQTLVDEKIKENKDDGSFLCYD